MLQLEGKYSVRIFLKFLNFKIKNLSLFSLIGVGEVALLPLDVLKIKRQTAPETLKGRNIFKIFWDEGLGLYR